SYCCKPFTAHDPGRLVESHKYLLDLAVSQPDPTKPTCAVVQLAPDRILCRDCCELFGYPAGEGVGGSGAEAPSATGQEGGMGASAQPQNNGRPESTPQEAMAPDRSPGARPRFGDWAFAIEHGGACQLFRHFGDAWRHQGKAQGITPGRQEDLLLSFAKGGGLLTVEEAVRSVQQTASREDRMKILSLLKPALSRLRRAIRSNLNVTDMRANPLPWDKHARAWQAAVQIGYAVRNDEGRLEFKLF